MEPAVDVPAIDIHSHYVPRGWPPLPGADPAWLRIASDCWDPAVRRTVLAAADDPVAQELDVAAPPQPRTADS